MIVHHEFLQGASAQSGDVSWSIESIGPSNLAKYVAPSAHQTWQWKMDHLSVMSLIKPSIHRRFSSQPCLITRG